MLKRRVSLLLVVLMLVGMIGFSATSVAASPTLSLNGTVMNAKVFTKSGVPMFPVRLICEKLGYTYYYKSGKATITTNDDVLTMTKGSRNFYDGSKTLFKLDTYPVLQSSMLYAPATFFSDLMGMSYAKDSSGNYTLKTATAVAAPTAAGATPTPTAAPLGNVYLNDKQISANSYMNAKNYLMVQLQPLVQTFGGTINMSGTTAVVNVGGAIAYVDPSSGYFTFNGQNTTMVTLPEMTSGVLYVPIGFIEKVFSATYLYSGNILKIYTTMGVAQSEFNVRLNNTLLAYKGYYNAAGKEMLPVKALGEALGFTYSFDGNTVKLVKSTTTITFIPGQTTYYLGWGAQTYGASETRGNDCYVPMDMAKGMLGITSGSLTMGEMVLSSTGSTAGGIPIKMKNGAGYYVETGVYAKPSADGKTILIPVNTLVANLGYSPPTLGSGNSTVNLTKLSDNKSTNAYNITVTLGQTYYQLYNGSALFSNLIAAAAPEMSVGTLYVTPDVITNGMGFAVTGSAVTEVLIG